MHRGCRCRHTQGSWRPILRPTKAPTRTFLLFLLSKERPFSKQQLLLTHTKKTQLPKETHKERKIAPTLAGAKSARVALLPGYAARPLLTHSPVSASRCKYVVGQFGIGDHLRVKSRIFYQPLSTRMCVPLPPRNTHPQRTLTATCEAFACSDRQPQP